MFKVNKKDTRTYFTPCSSVSIVNFEQVIAGWGVILSNVKEKKIVFFYFFIFSG